MKRFPGNSRPDFEDPVRRFPPVARTSTLYSNLDAGVDGPFAYKYQYWWEETSAPYANGTYTITSDGEAFDIDNANSDYDLPNVFNGENADDTTNFFAITGTGANITIELPLTILPQYYTVSTRTDGSPLGASQSPEEWTLSCISDDVGVPMIRARARPGRLAHAAGTRS